MPGQRHRPGHGDEALPETETIERPAPPRADLDLPRQKKTTSRQRPYATAHWSPSNAEDYQLTEATTAVQLDDIRRRPSARCRPNIVHS